MRTSFHNRVFQRALYPLFLLFLLNACIEPEDLIPDFSAIDYTPNIQFSITAQESLNYTIANTCKSSEMPPDERFVLLNTANITANIPEDGPQAGMIQIDLTPTGKPQLTRTLPITPGVPAQLELSGDMVNTWKTGQDCNFTAAISISHLSGPTITGTMQIKGKIAFPDVPEDLDTDAIEYRISINTD